MTRVDCMDLFQMIQANKQLANIHKKKTRKAMISIVFPSYVDNDISPSEDTMFLLQIIYMKPLNENYGSAMGSSSKKNKLLEIRLPTVQNLYCGVFCLYQKLIRGKKVVIKVFLRYRWIKCQVFRARYRIKLSVSLSVCLLRRLVNSKSLMYRLMCSKATH